MAAQPQRIQLKRTKGFNLQAVSMALNGLPAVKCARPGKWGNPNRVGKPAYVPGVGQVMVETREQAVAFFSRNVLHPTAGAIYRENVRAALAGKNLACFCPLDKPCHCDLLLKLANA